MTAEENRATSIDDKHLSMLSEYELCGWSSTRAEVQKHLQLYWSYRDETVIIDGLPMKGRRISISESFQG